jgi:hypothetical protein
MTTVPAAARSDRTAADIGAEVSRTRVSSIIAWVLLVVSLLAWRTGVYYSGGLDTVVMAKAALDIVALVIALTLLSHRPAGQTLSVRTLLFVLAFVGVCTIGAAAEGNLVASSVLGVRLLLVCGTVSLLVVACSRKELVDGFMFAMGVTGLVCAVTGAGSVLGGGRLTGGLLPIAPNQIGLLVGVPIIWAVWCMAQGRGRLFHVLVVVGGLGLTWLTGSRSGLAALVLASLLVVALAPRLRLGGFLTLTASIPFVFYFVAFTGLFSAYFGRGGSENITTLNSRTIAWRAAFEADTDFWGHWFGGGLSVKLVPVSGPYLDAQVLDSTWVSTFVQAGVVGLVIVFLWAVTTMWKTLSAPVSYKGLWAGLVAYALMRSVLETGLLDSYALFLVILVPSLACDIRTSTPRAPGPDAAPRPARDSRTPA